MKKQSGIYKLVYLPTKQFYIGGTRNLHSRWHSHKSQFKANNNVKNLQEVYNITGDINDWQIKLIAPCSVRSLNRIEQHYIDKHKNNKQCLNHRTIASGGRRNIQIDAHSRERLAVSLLGKNTKDKNIYRPNNLTFVSPTGVEYKNIISVKRFAEEHNLNQAPLNTMANGKLDSVNGWTVKGAQLPHAASVAEYWSRQRMLQNFPEYTIIGPDGTVYKTFVIYYFEKEHNCKVITKEPTRHSGAKSHTRGLDDMGRGYRLHNISYFRVTHEGKVYDNIISLGKWATYIGMTERQRDYYLYIYRTKQNVKPQKRSITFQVERIYPNLNDNYKQ
jgi:group I intron endonuclease